MKGRLLTCREGHQFTSGAKTGQAVKCPLCRVNGKLVSVWVKESAPLASRPARAASTPVTPVKTPNTATVKPVTPRPAAARTATPAYPLGSRPVPSPVTRRGPVQAPGRTRNRNWKPPTAKDLDDRLCRDAIIRLCQAKHVSVTDIAARADKLRWTPRQLIAFLEVIPPLPKPAGLSPRASTGTGRR